MHGPCHTDCDLHTRQGSEEVQSHVVEDQVPVPAVAESVVDLGVETDALRCVGLCSGCTHLVDPSNKTGSTGSKKHLQRVRKTLFMYRDLEGVYCTHTHTYTHTHARDSTPGSEIGGSQLSRLTRITARVNRTRPTTHSSNHFPSPLHPKGPHPTPPRCPQFLTECDVDGFRSRHIPATYACCPPSVVMFS